MNQEERDDLWELLGRARPVRVSPLFARNVLRALREEPPPSSGILVWLRARWPMLAAASCAVGFAAVALWPEPEPVESPASLAALAEVVGTSPDYAVIGNLDELLAAEESSAWLSPSVD